MSPSEQEAKEPAKPPVKKTAVKKPRPVESLNIHQRIQEVKRIVKYVRKTTEVKAGRETYMAVSHDEVTRLLHDPMVDWGINTRANVEQQSIETQEVGRSQAGTPKMRLMSVWIIAFINVDNPQDLVYFTIPVHADDFGDKAPGKACSMAVKIAMLKCFGLESGENEEERLQETEGGARKTTPEEVQQLRDLIAQSSGTEEQFLEYIKKDPMLARITTLDELSHGVWEWAIKFIQSRIDKQMQESDSAPEDGH